MEEHGGWNIGENIEGNHYQCFTGGDAVNIDTGGRFFIGKCSNNVRILSEILPIRVVSDELVPGAVLNGVMTWVG